MRNIMLRVGIGCMDCRTGSYCMYLIMVDVPCKYLDSKYFDDQSVFIKSQGRKDISVYRYGFIV